MLALDQYIDLVIPRGSNTGPEKGVQWHGKHGGGRDVPKGGRMHGWCAGDGGHAASFGVRERHGWGLGHVGEGRVGEERDASAGGCDVLVAAMTHQWRL